MQNIFKDGKFTIYQQKSCHVQEIYFQCSYFFDDALWQQIPSILVQSTLGTIYKQHLQFSGFQTPLSSMSAVFLVPSVGILDQCMTSLPFQLPTLFMDDPLLECNKTKVCKNSNQSCYPELGIPQPECCQKCHNFLLSQCCSALGVTQLSLQMPV